MSVQPVADTPIPEFVRRYDRASPTVIGWALEHLPFYDFDEWRRWYRNWEALKTSPNIKWRQQYYSDHNNAVLGLCDRFFLLVHLLGRKDLTRTTDRAEGGAEWLYERCREVEADPDEHLDLWSREHYKSTLITFAGALQEALRNPEITICIFSDVAKVAKPFLHQIMLECEGNEFLKQTYSDVLWSEPKRQAKWWSLQRGIVFKRTGNPREATIEAHGLIEGAPTGRHFNLRIYDDIVTRETVTNPEMVRRVTETWELSDNLGAQPNPRRWHIGTRYTLADTYQTILDRKVLTPRVYPATDDGTLDGEPVLLTKEAWEQKKETQPSTVAAQMLQNPAAGKQAAFLPQWLRAYDIRPHTLHVYILCDPSKGPSAKQRSDRTAMAVLGMDSAQNVYLLDGYCHRMDLDERWRKLRDLHRKWTRAKGVLMVTVGYEQYGMQSDLEHFELEMIREKYSFPIEEVNWPRQGEHSKEDRVRRLVPLFKRSRFYLPLVVWHETFHQATWNWSDDEGRVVHTQLEGLTRLQRKTMEAGQAYRVVKSLIQRDEDNDIYDLTRELIEELLYFPFGAHDDFVDAVSRIYDIDANPPNIQAQRGTEDKAYIDT